MSSIDLNILLSVSVERKSFRPAQQNTTYFCCKYCFICWNREITWQTAG